MYMPTSQLTTFVSFWMSFLSFLLKMFLWDLLKVCSLYAYKQTTYDWFFARRFFFPIFNQIREVNASFCLLAKLHGRSIDANNAFHITKRCEKLREKLKLVECINGIALFPMSDIKNRLILPIEHWCSIVQNSHVNNTGKHLSPKSTFNALHEKWSTNIKVGGIQASSIGTLPPILPNLLRF